MCQGASCGAGSGRKLEKLAGSAETSVRVLSYLGLSLCLAGSRLGLCRDRRDGRD